MQTASEFSELGNCGRKVFGAPLSNLMRSYRPGAVLFSAFLLSLLMRAHTLAAAVFVLCVSYLLLWRAVNDNTVQAQRAAVDKQFFMKWKKHDARFVGCAWQTYRRTGSPAHLQIYQLRLRRYQQEYGELPDIVTSRPQSEE